LPQRYLGGASGISTCNCNVRKEKFKIRRIFEVLVLVSEHARRIQIKKFIVFNFSFKKRALKTGLLREKNINFQTNEKLESPAFICPNIHAYAIAIWG
jgi:hypothetical protein